MLRAQSDANTLFLHPLRHRIRRHSKYARHRQHRGQQTHHTQHRGRRSLRNHRAIHLVLPQRHRERDIRFDISKRATQRSRHLVRRQLRPHNQHRPRRQMPTHALRHRKEHRRGSVLHQSSVLAILHNPNHLIPGRGPQKKMSPNRWLIAEHPLRKSLIHHRHPGRRTVVVPAELATRHQPRLRGLR